jgi:hypothetical protein
LEDRLNDPKPSIETWLRTNEKYLIQSLQRETDKIKDGNHRITRFFSVKRNESRPQTLHPNNTKTTMGNISRTNVRSSNLQTAIEEIPESQQTSESHSTRLYPRMKHDLRPP